jgi:hypothetical protein
MVSESGETFDIEIPTFSLDTPAAEHQGRDSPAAERRLN